MAMQLTFDVGTTETHQVVFAFDKFWGGLTITVDGNSVVNQTRLFSFDWVATWQASASRKESPEPIRIGQPRLLRRSKVKMPSSKSEYPA